MAIPNSYEHIRYANPDLPVSLFAFKRLSDSDEETLSVPRWHQELELKYFVAGCAEMTCGSSVFTAGPGDLCVINPCEYHRITPIPGAETPVYHLMMLNLRHPLFRSLQSDCFVCSAKAAEPAPTLAFPIFFRHRISGTASAAGRIFRLMAETAADYDFARTAYLAELSSALMIALTREARDDSAPPTKIYYHAQYAQTLHLAFEYIDEHSDEVIRLDTLARLCCLSVSRFSHVFRQATGVSPIAYIRKLKVNKAVNMLTHTQASLADVAHSAGFTDYAYFCRVFRQIMDASPTEYRARQIDKG